MKSLVWLEAVSRCWAGITKYNKEGRATISKGDEWAKETEWDDMFEQMKRERGVKE